MKSFPKNVDHYPHNDQSWKPLEYKFPGGLEQKRDNIIETEILVVYRRDGGLGGFEHLKNRETENRRQFLIDTQHRHQVQIDDWIRRGYGTRNDIFDFLLWAWKNGLLTSTDGLIKLYWCQLEYIKNKLGLKDGAGKEVDEEEVPLELANKILKLSQEVEEILFFRLCQKACPEALIGRSVWTPIGLESCKEPLDYFLDREEIKEYLKRQIRERNTIHRTHDEFDENKFITWIRYSNGKRTKATHRHHVMLWYLCQAVQDTINWSELIGEQALGDDPSPEKRYFGCILAELRRWKPRVNVLKKNSLSVMVDILERLGVSFNDPLDTRKKDVRDEWGKITIEWRHDTKAGWASIFGAWIDNLKVGIEAPLVLPEPDVPPFFGLPNPLKRKANNLSSEDNNHEHKKLKTNTNNALSPKPNASNINMILRQRTAALEAKRAYKSSGYESFSFSHDLFWTPLLIDSYNSIPLYTDPNHVDLPRNHPSKYPPPYRFSYDFPRTALSDDSSHTIAPLSGPDHSHPPSVPTARALPANQVARPPRPILPARAPRRPVTSADLSAQRAQKSSGIAPKVALPTPELLEFAIQCARPQEDEAMAQPAPFALPPTEPKSTTGAFQQQEMQTQDQQCPHGSALSISTSPASDHAEIEYWKNRVAEISANKDAEIDYYKDQVAELSANKDAEIDYYKDQVDDLRSWMKEKGVL